MTHVAGHLASSPLSNAEYDNAVGGGGGTTSGPRTQLRDLPDGRTVLINMDTGEEIRTVAQVAPKAGAEPKNLGAGVFEDDTGYYVSERVPAPGGRGGTVEEKRYITRYEADRILKGGGSGSAPSGPSASEITAQGNLSARWGELGENRRQFDAEQARRQQEMQQRSAEFEAQMVLARREFEERMRVNQEAQAQIQLEMEFSRQKEAFAQSQDNKRLVLDTQAQMFNQQTSLATLQQRQSEMEFSYAVTQAQMQQAADQFNASMGFSVDQANEAAQRAKRQDLAQAARDVGELSRSPTDFGELAAFSLANTGWGMEDARMQEGDGFITDQSLTPLEAGLRNREDIAASPDNPYSFTPATAPTLPALNFPALPTAPDLSFLNGLMTPPTVTAPVEQRFSGAADDPALREAASGPMAAGADRDAVIAALEAANRLPRKAEGGMVEGAYMGDEEGPEMHIPLAEGVALVIPADKVRKMGDAKRKRLKSMATGGVFAEGIFEGLGSDRTLSRGFQSEAVRRARASSPWQTGALPGATFASTPGLSPAVIDLLAAIRGLELGEPADYFKQRAGRLTPAGMSERVIGRTA